MKLPKRILELSLPGYRLPWRGEYALSNSLFLIIWSRKNGLPGLPAGRWFMIILCLHGYIPPEVSPQIGCSYWCKDDTIH